MHFMNKSPGKDLKEILKKFKIDENIIAGFGWTVQTAIVAFLSGHQLGAGPLSWLLNVELIPCKVLENGRWFDSSYRGLGFQKSLLGSRLQKHTSPARAATKDARKNGRRGSVF